MLSLDESYEYCRELTQRSAHNFRFSFMTLSGHRRNAMNAFYAFNRITDDLGDEEGFALELRRIRLSGWRESVRFALNRATPQRFCEPSPLFAKYVDHALSRPESIPAQPDTAEMGTFTEHPALPAIADLVTRYQIPHEYLYAVIDGVEMDLYPCEIATFADLERYCFHVAGAVGLGCIHVWGFRDERAIPLANDCGLAFQLTNILRDVGEDGQSGRIYLPREDLERFGYSAQELLERRMNDRFVELMKFQAQRAKDYYAQAEQLFAYLEPPGRPILRAMMDIYAGVLKQIERNRFDVFSTRASLPKWLKLWYAARAIVIAR